MRKVNQWICRIEEVLVVIFLTTLVSVAFSNVIFRYIFKNSLGWGEELSCYCFIMGTYIGLSIVTRQDRHITIDAIDFIFPKINKYVPVIADLVSMVYVSIIIIYSVKLLISFIQSEELSIAMRLPMWIPYFSIPLGFTLTLLRLLTQFPEKLRALKNSLFCA